MSGSDDLLSGFDSAIWNQDPSDAESLVGKQQNARLNISNARNAAIAESAKQAIRPVLDRNLPRSASRNAPLAGGFRISGCGEWVGAYRAVAHSAGNLLVERGRKLLNRTKPRFRLSKQTDVDSYDYAERPEIIEDDEDLFGDREGSIGPIHIPDDAD